MKLNENLINADTKHCVSIFRCLAYIVMIAFTSVLAVNAQTDFTVTFHFGGQRPDSTVSVTSGNTVTEPADPDSTGYRFDGWFLDNAWSQAFDFSGAITQNTTLYAKWTELHTVTYLYNPGGATYDIDTVANNEKANAPALPDSLHLSFDDWYNTEDYSGSVWDFDNLITQDTTLYARWRAQVTFDPRGGTRTTLNSDTTVYADSVIHAANWSDPVNPPFTFEGWYTDTVTYNNRWDLDTDPVTRDTTLYARWVATVTFNTNGGTPTTGDTIVNANTPVENWSEPVRQGLHFNGWYTDNGAFTDEWDLDADSVKRDTTLYARWMARVTFDPNGGSINGSITPADTSVDVNHNVSEWTHLPTRAYHTFNGWYADQACTIPFALTGDITRDSTVYAKWTIHNYTVTYLLEPGGATFTTQTADHGDLLSAPDPAPDSTGYTLVGWYKDVAGSMAWNFATDIVTQDTTLYARWTLLMLKVTLPNPSNTEGLTGIVVTSSGSFIQESDTVYSVPYGRSFSFRPEYETGYSDTASIVTVNGVRIRANNDGVYTVPDIREQVVIGIEPVVAMYRVEFPLEFPASDVYGVYYIKSGDDFTFLLPSDIVPPGKELRITTGRANDLEGGVVITLKDNGKYEVVIRDIRENITVQIELVTGNDDIPTAKVWAYDHTLYITSLTNSEARIYNTSGILAKILPCLAGETAKTQLERGIYIVVIDGKARKVVIN
jgi:uncharacterized repeat protein (TIGR02543 family)